MAWLLARGEKNLNTRGALLHVMGDLLGSVTALLSGLVIAFTGWTPIDPVLSLAIGALILFSSLSLLREALHGLMEGAPFAIAPEEVGRALAGVPGVASVHDLHIWQVKAGQPLLSASTGQTVRVVINAATYPQEVRAQMKKVESGDYTSADIDLFQDLQWAYAKKLVSRPVSVSVDLVEAPDYAWPEPLCKNLDKRRDNDYKEAPEVHGGSPR